MTNKIAHILPNRFFLKWRILVLLVLSLLSVNTTLTAQISDTLVFGSDAFYSPYEFLDKSNNPTGFNVELIRAIAIEMNVPIKIKLGNWETIRNEVE